jgi:hypothetical protein
LGGGVTKLETIKVGRRTYLVESVAESDVHIPHVLFVLHDPRGRKYVLVPDPQRPDRLVGFAPVTYFSRFRPTPFGGLRFVVEDDGKLTVAVLDP